MASIHSMWQGISSLWRRQPATPELPKAVVTAVTSATAQSGAGVGALQVALPPAENKFTTPPVAAPAPTQAAKPVEPPLPTGRRLGNWLAALPETQFTRLNNELTFTFRHSLVASRVGAERAAFNTEFDHLAAEQLRKAGADGRAAEALWNSELYRALIEEYALRGGGRPGKYGDYSFCAGDGRSLTQVLDPLIRGLAKARFPIYGTFQNGRSAEELRQTLATYGIQGVFLDKGGSPLTGEALMRAFVKEFPLE